MTAHLPLEQKYDVAANGCWIWNGKPRDDGYGRWGRKSRAHRAMYEALVGPIPDGLDLGHTCHDDDPDCPGGKCLHRLCVNPDHLKPMTRRENLLAGKTRPAAQVLRLRCPQNHPYSAENTYTNPVTHKRQCRICHRASDAKRARMRRSLKRRM